MRTIIAGSRTITDPQRLTAALAACGWVPTVVLCGCAVGVDRMGHDWARANGIPVEFFPAWEYQAIWAQRHARHNEKTHWPNPSLPKGKGAGFARNTLMAQNAKALVALWDGRSRGTKHMIDAATRSGLSGLKVYAHMVYAPLVLGSEWDLYEGDAP